MSAQKHGALQIVGFNVGATGMNNGMSTFPIDAASDWLAFSYTPPENKTLAKVQAYCSAITGSPIAADADCELYSSSAQAPASSIEAVSAADANPAVDFMQWSGFTSALTAGTQYWFVFKNANATPGSNFYTLRFGGGGTFPQGVLLGLATTQSSFAKRQTTDSGVSWAGSPVSAVAFLRLEFSDGTFDGFPFSNLAGLATLDRVFSDDELGVQFTTPSNGVLNVRGLLFYPHKVGTPTGNLRYRLYSGATPSLLATTAGVATPGQITTSLGFPTPLWFSAAQTIQPGTVLTAVMGETTQSDTSANAYSTAEFTIQNTAASKALLPFGGIKKARFDGTTWTYTDTSAVPFGLILDTDGEFGAGGGGGLLVHPGMGGGLRG